MRRESNLLPRSATFLNTRHGSPKRCSDNGLSRHSPHWHEAMKNVVRAVSDERKLALLRIHPDLAGKTALAGTMTADSKSEQGSAGLDRLSAQELKRFQALNDAYKAKFGFPFIVCVRRHTKDFDLPRIRDPANKQRRGQRRSRARRNLPDHRASSRTAR